MSNKPLFKILLTFMDESQLIYVTNSTDRKAALADFYSKHWLEIDGEFYNKDLIFKWKLSE